MAIAGSSPQQQHVADALVTKMFNVMAEDKTITIRNWTATHDGDGEVVVQMDVQYSMPVDEFNRYVTEAYGNSE